MDVDNGHTDRSRGRRRGIGRLLCVVGVSLCLLGTTAIAASAQNATDPRAPDASLADDELAPSDEEFAPVTAEELTAADVPPDSVAQFGPVDPRLLGNAPAVAPAVLFADAWFSGASQSLQPGAYVAARGDLPGIGDNTVSSLRVPAGVEVVLCDHADVDAGECVWYPAGQHGWVGGFNDRTSVVFVLGPMSGTGVIVYADSGQRGVSRGVPSPTSRTSATLAPVRDDTISSVRVGLGRSAVLCEHEPRAAGASLGRCARYTAGDHNLPGSLNDRASFVAAARTTGGPARLTHLDGVRLDDALLAGSHNTFEKMGCNPARSGCSPNDPNFHYLWDAFDHVQVIELDVWTQDGRWYVNHHGWLENNNNCPKSGLYDSPRNQDLRSCIDGLRAWHLAYPDHPLAIIKLEMKDGFRSGYSPTGLDEVVANVSGGGQAARLPRDWLFTPADLMRCRVASCPAPGFRTPDEAARAGNWPTLGELRGKFMFVVTRGAYRAEGARQYANALMSGQAQLMFPSMLLETMRAGGDSRIGYYSATAAPWVVVFDMQYGRLHPEFTPEGIKPPTIDPAVVAPLDGQGYLLFTSIGNPLEFFPPSMWSIPSAPARGTLEWGNLVIRTARQQYGFNVINTDREKAGLRFPGLNS